MVNLTLSEATLNAVRAALDERVARLEQEIGRLNERADEHAAEFLEDGTGLVVFENLSRALIWNIAALHETKTAVEDFAEVNCTDHPAEATWEAWTQGELVAVFGR